mgnify:CR=1 FL=1
MFAILIAIAVGGAIAIAISSTTSIDSSRRHVVSIAL